MTFSSWRKRSVYVVMAGLALLACSLDHSMQRRLHKMELTIQQALRLSLFRLLDGLQEAELQKRIQREQDAAAAYQHQAAAYQTKATREQHYAEMERDRGDYLERLSQMETSQAALHAQMAQQDDEDRLALLQNITTLEQDKNDTLTYLQEIHQGACAWKVMSAICSTVGGATALQQRADADSLAIAKDWQEATLEERQEFMENLVAEIMTTKAHRYDAAAHDLYHMADKWDTAAQTAAERARVDNVTSLELERDVAHDQKAMEQDVRAEHKVDLFVTRLMQSADEQRSAAYWCAVGALLTAATALVFFVARVIPKAHIALHVWEYTRDTSRMAYAALHVLIFASVMGLAGHFLVYLEHYTTVQRAIILIWFASVASLGQTLGLHALPWVLQQLVTSTTHEPANPMTFCVEMACRVVVLSILFLMEILLIWLALGHAIFSPLVVGICANWFFRLVVLAAVVAYGVRVEGPRREAQSTAAMDETATLASSSSWPENRSILLTEASEVTPLRKADLTSWGTTIDLAPRAGEATHGTVTSNTTTALGELLQDLARLILPLDILLVACMLAVLRNALHVVWISHATWIQCSVLVCAMALLLLAFWFTHEACCEQTWASSLTKSRSKDPATSALRMRPKFEMVQV